MSDPKTKDEILAERAIIAKLVHAAFCPNCEAAARERDAAYEDSRQMQERLQRLIDAEPQQELADLRARLAKASRLLDQVAEFQAFTMPEFEQARELLREKEAK